MAAVKSFGAVLGAAVWISLSEFVRNEFLVKSYWIEHYSAMGQVFPSAPVNGALWGVWSLLLVVLPLGILPYAIPLSLLEAFLAAFMVYRIAP